MPAATSIAERAARYPFLLRAGAHLIRIEPQRANTLAELLEGLRACSDGSIFEHTFQSLQEHHYFTEGFSNDFAQWVMAACNEAPLAERLSAVDVRDFTEIASLRARLVETVESYLAQTPEAASRPAFEPFYFYTSELFVVPTPYEARNLEEFRQCVENASLHSIHYHFVDARLRLKLDSNDFSAWLEEVLELPKAAAEIKRIDFYTLTLEGVRKKILEAVDRELHAARQKNPT